MMQQDVRLQKQTGELENPSSEHRCWLRRRTDHLLCFNSPFKTDHVATYLRGVVKKMKVF